VPIRIIGGKYRHRQLKFLVDAYTRPTKDRIREAIFSAIGAATNQANVLDLYCGVGTFGLEALSRGATNVTFVDQRIDVIKVVQENLNLLNEKGVLINQDAISALKSLAETHQQFDLVFFDPPYQNQVAEEVINRLNAYALLKDGAIIVYEGQVAISASTLTEFKVKDYHYGQTIVQIIRKK
jgi:16S rRNA (guanine966-N2)-methyltransferase